MFKREIQKLRTAFSMLELIFVIVVLGIVSSIGAEIIANVYEGYIVQRAQYRSTMKVENTLTQIANRLTYAIPGTVVRRITTGGAFEAIVNPMFLDPSGNTYSVLQWVTKDADSFNAISAEDDRLPGWSGFCDVNKSTGTTIETPGSNFTLASSIIGYLGGSLSNARIYFSGQLNETNLLSQDYTISSATGTTITLSTAPTEEAKQKHYKLAWTSNALSVEGGNLYLYHNFTPSPAATIGGTKTLLLRNVTNFKFRGDGRTIRIKICVKEQIGDGYTPSCSERAIF